MHNQRSAAPGLRSLYLASFLERFVFSGIQSIVFLFMISGLYKQGLAMDEASAYLHMANFASLMLMMPLLAGLLADMVFSKTEAIAIGVICMVVACLCFALVPTSNLLPWFALFAFGSGLFWVSKQSLFALSFPHAPEKYASVYTFDLLGISLGAFLGSIAIAYISELYSYSAGFIAAGGCISLALPILLLRNRSQIAKTPGMLFASYFTPQNLARSILIILVILLLLLMSDSISGMASSQLNSMPAITDSQNSVAMIGDLLFSLIGCVLLSLLWLTLRINNWFKLAAGFLLYALAWQTIGYMSADLATGNIVTYWFAVHFILSLSSLIISPTIHALVAQYAPKKLIATCFGLVLASAGLTNWAAGIIGAFNPTMIPYLVASSIIISLLILLGVGYVGKERERRTIAA